MTLNQGTSRTYSSVVAGKWFGKLMEGGIPPKTIENRSHVRLEQLENVDGRIPLPDFQRLIQCSYDLLEDEAMALRVGAAANPNEMGILGYILLNCRTLVEMLHATVQYSPLLTDLRMQLTEKRKHFELELLSSNPDACDLDHNPLIRYRVESTFAWTVTIFRCFKRELRPDTVFFKHSRPGYEKAYRHVFQTSLHFNQPTNKMLFFRKDLEERWNHSNPYLLKLYRQHAEKLLAALRPPKSFEQRIETIISGNLARNVVNLDMVADQLQVNRWKLARLLREHQTSFQEIQDGVRLNLARMYLKDTAFQIGDIHELLGYSEASAFTRAFKRWTGISPRDFRQQFHHPPATGNPLASDHILT